MDRIGPMDILENHTSQLHASESKNLTYSDTNCTLLRVDDALLSIVHGPINSRSCGTYLQPSKHLNSRTPDTTH